jgi:hypothetical protein
VPEKPALVAISSAVKSHARVDYLRDPIRHCERMPAATLHPLIIAGSSCERIVSFFWKEYAELRNPGTSSLYRKECDT